MLVAAHVTCVFLATVGVASSMQLTSKVHQEVDGVYWMRLTNMGDVEYTGLMRIGRQQVKAIVDTGSFELVVFGVNCNSCGSASNLYNSSKSREYLSSGFMTQHSYGSGTVDSVEASDAVQIGKQKIPRQMFWEVVAAKMPILSAGSFQAILGVGPPSSIITFAEDRSQEIHKEFTMMRHKGGKVTKKVEQIVAHYDDLVIHAKNTTSVAESLRMQNMAVCLNKRSGSHGYYIWNDHRASQMPDKFTEVAVTGAIYWSANLTNVELGLASLGGNVSKAEKAAATKKTRFSREGGQRTIGCVSETCSAVIDTGTSLIVAPTEMAKNVFDAMREWIEAGGTCDDLSKLPDLEFNLNGKQFSLPPEAYVGEIKGDLNADMMSFMPHLYREHHKIFSEIGCQPLIMTMDADSQFGPLWILGMPFFRKYYTNFKFVQHIGKMSVPLASTMSFAVADSKCRPGHSPEDDRKESRLLESRWTQRSAQLRVDASKLRISSLAHNIRARAGSALLLKPRVQI